MLRLQAGPWPDPFTDHIDGWGEENKPQDETEHVGVVDQGGEEPGPDENSYKAAYSDPGCYPPIQVPPHQVAGSARDRGEYDYKKPGPDGDGRREPEVEVHDREHDRRSADTDQSTEDPGNDADGDEEEQGRWCK
jgi:hypothetical protein